MMKKCWLILAGSCVAGCSLSNNGLQYEAVSSTNLYHIERVRKGMSEKQVLQIMHKPYSYESFISGEDVYDIWFYVTKPTVLDQSRMVAQNLTPLTFKNGVLVGTGYSWYYYAMKEQAAAAAAHTPPAPKPKSQGAEDKEFEQTLDDIANQRKSQAAPVPKTNPGLSAYIKPWNETPLGVTPKTLSKVRIGMSDVDVQTILGSPSRQETLQVDDEVYNVWFYDVSPQKKNAAATSAPLTFKGGVLVGITTHYYDNIRQKADQDSQVRGYTRQDEKMQQDESEQNFNFW